MEIGILGLPQSGRTALFSALTRGKVEKAAHSPAGPAPAIGVVPVPDARLEVLNGIFHPKKLVHATVKYVDIPSASDFGRGTGIGGTFLLQLSDADALLLVVRVFRDERVPHVRGSVDPARDLAALMEELAFSDLSIIERRKERLAESLKGARAGERDAYLHEDTLLDRVKAELEKGVPLRQQKLAADEARMIEGYRFLSAKPVMVVLNIDEADLPRAPATEGEFSGRLAGAGVQFVALCAKLEAELAQLGEAEAAEFRRDLGLAEPALDRLIQLSYRLLGLVSFFTVVSGEVRAWTVPQGTSAVRAAGKIHTDMERGFIRAEVVSLADLVKCGSLAEARHRGLLRLEGKTYPVQDGDVITFLFNV